MKRPFKDIRPLGPVFSQDDLGSFGGPTKQPAKPGDGVYRLSYILETSEDKNKIREDVELAVASIREGPDKEVDHMLIEDVFINEAGMSKYEAEIRFIPDVENTSKIFVSQELVDEITKQLELMPGYSVSSNWKLDFMVTK